MYQKSLLSRWWKTHHEFQGQVFITQLSFEDITHPEEYVNNLFAKYKKIPFEEVLAFAESEVTDNSMPNREILEDGSKIHMLRNEIRNDNLHFRTQVLHEPWYDRYRIHPGSGRAAAMWLEGQEYIESIYMHFSNHRKGYGFKIPDNAYQIGDPMSFERFIKLKDVDPYYESYPVFPKTAKECLKTQEMDREWHWHYVTCYAPFKFLRWSEGKNFLDYKTLWRSHAIDLWNELN